MAQLFTNGRETFHKFFESWIVEQNRFLQELVAASASAPATADTVLHTLIARVVDHYEHYYCWKSRWAKADVLAMFNPTWLSSLEDALLWVGGWRPSMAFHLLYSKSGLQLDARLADVLRGLGTGGDLGDLSPAQLDRVDRLQAATIREEKAISEKLAKHQETVADPAMVELAHAATEVMRDHPGSGGGEDDGQVDATLKSKEEGLVEVLRMADDLRLKTLKEVIQVLTPIQSAHFLIAAAELHLRVHEWGGKRDARHRQDRELGD